MLKGKRLCICDSELAQTQHLLRHALCYLRFLYVDRKIYRLLRGNFLRGFKGF